MAGRYAKIKMVKKQIQIVEKVLRSYDERPLDQNKLDRKKGFPSCPIKLTKCIKLLTRHVPG